MIYADENVWHPVAEGLRRRGWTVTTALEAATIGLSDRAHLEYATERGWVLLTFDDDFVRLANTQFSGVDHAGIVYAEQHGNDVGDLVQSIDAVLRRCEDVDMSGTVRFV